MVSLNQHRLCRRRRRLWLGYWLCLFIATHVPVPIHPRVGIANLDKIAHFGLYFVLAWLGGRWLWTRGRGKRFLGLVLWGLIYAGYGMLDEWIQSFVGRNMSAADFAADAIGIVSASLLFALVMRRRGISEPTGI